MEWILSIMIVAGFQKAPEPVVIVGENPYLDEDTCKEVGTNLISWLSQDGVKAYFRCDPRLHVAEAK